MAVVYYCRVSAKDQNLARQIEAFKQIGAKEEEIICDKESGKDFGRENYQALKSMLGLRAGDTLVVKDCCAIMGLNQKDLENQGILA